MDIEYCLNTGNVTLGTSADVTGTNAYIGGIVAKAGAGSAGAYTGNVNVNYCLNVGLIKSNHAQAVNMVGGVAAFTAGLSASGDVTVCLKNSFSALTYDEYNVRNNVEVVVGKDNGATITGCECIDYDLMKGQFAYYYMPLDYYTTADTTGYWYARENSHPIPVPFGSNSSYTLITSFSVVKTTATPAAFYDTHCKYSTTGGGTVRRYDDIGPGLSIQIPSTNWQEFEAYAE